MTEIARLEGLGSRRRADAAGPRVARTGWLLITLLQGTPVEYAVYRDMFGVDKRTFQRDVRAVAEIVAPRGGIVQTKGGRAFLESSDRIARLGMRTRAAGATLARIAAAFGGPLERELRDGVVFPTPDAAAAASAFLQPRGPSPAADERVTRIYVQVKKAAADHATVEFAYRSNTCERTMRHVEPYQAVLRDGRYYLTAYDRTYRGWRKFCLDRIDEATLRRSGSFQPRSVPAQYADNRAAGWISGPVETEVTYRVSPRAAASVIAKVYQPEQRVTALPDGGVEISLRFSDLDEAARWSLSLGADATIVAPSEAVAHARQIAGRIFASYDPRARVALGPPKAQGRLERRAG